MHTNAPCATRTARHAWRRPSTVLLAIAALCAAGCAGPRVRLASTNEAEFARAAIATDHPLASQAGAEMLARGGNAVDASVAASFALSVVRPYSCGLGGGGFMLIHLPDDPTHGFVSVALNYRETTPAGVGPDFYEQRDDPDASTVGAAAVAIPGTVAGLLTALDRYGSLPRETVLAPAIRLAEDGFNADEHYAATARDRIDWFNQDPARIERFAFLWTRFLGSGRVEVGNLIRNPEQAHALRLIARDGAAAFYNGPIADAIVRRITADRGVLNHADLANYTTVQTTPLVGAYAGRVVLAFPPPSSGGIAIVQVLGVLDRLGWPGPDGAGADHLFIEACKHAFADRARSLADPAFAPVPIDDLLDPALLDARARSIDLHRTFPPDHYGLALPTAADHGTSHISVVDANSGAVACTETINLLFGSMLEVPEYGFCLNNEMDDFLTRRGEANAFGLTQSERNMPEPGKRPLSSMSPTILLGERHDPTDASGAKAWEVVGVAGASGGPRIITATLQALLLAERTGHAGAGVARPRVHHQWMPDIVFVEPDVSEARRAELTRRGHQLRERAELGVVQLIVRRTRHDAPGVWSAASDPRKGGRPAGLDR